VAIDRHLTTGKQLRRLGQLSSLYGIQKCRETRTLSGSRKLGQAERQESPDLGKKHSSLFLGVDMTPLDDAGASTHIQWDHLDRMPVSPQKAQSLSPSPPNLDSRIAPNPTKIQTTVPTDITTQAATTKPEHLPPATTTVEPIAQKEGKQPDPGVLLGKSLAKPYYSIDPARSLQLKHVGDFADVVSPAASAYAFHNAVKLKYLYDNNKGLALDSLTAETGAVPAAADSAALAAESQALAGKMRSNSFQTLMIGELANFGMDKAFFNKTPHSFRTVLTDCITPAMMLSEASWGIKLGAIVVPHLINRLVDTKTNGAEF
jgi:hypothetical protein